MSTASQTKAYIALVFICIAWGTTYLAIRIGVENFPAAFLYAGIRQVISGVIIMAAAFFISRKADLSWKSIRHQLLVGFLLISAGNGIVTWAEKYVSSGATALICALMPVLSVLINLMASRTEKLNWPIVVGMVFGFGGVGLIFKDNLSDFSNGNNLLGMLGIFAATTCWALGSVINKKRATVVNPVFNAGMQLFLGGLILLVVSPVLDDYSVGLSWNTAAVGSMAYLILFGSILAYTAYMYALKELPVGLVTSYAYVNPLVAVVLGYLILNEKLNWYIGLAFVSIIFGVYLVNMGYRRQKNAAQIKDFGNNAISALQTSEPQQ